MNPVNKDSSNFENTIIGESKAIKSVKILAKKIAHSSTNTTLIIGESGTGKELVARLIHNLSPHASQPFVDINCGAIPETLLESELFGYEKGAFTGANNQKMGFFELANGGTIFLDEIGNTTPNFQVKLLKAVENKRFRRIGGTEEINVSTRILAATNQDLLELVKMDKFREDLYYRLSVYQITIPPLRDRDRDVLVIGEHLRDYFNREYNRDIKGFTPAAKDFLLEYRWPGNVRQLKNSIERAGLVDKDGWLGVEDLYLDFGRNQQSAEVEKETNSNNDNDIAVLSDDKKIEISPEGISLELLERNVIFSALEQTNGNMSKTARLLKIKRGKLRYRLEKLGISMKEIYELKAGAFN